MSGRRLEGCGREDSICGLLHYPNHTNSVAKKSRQFTPRSAGLGEPEDCIDKQFGCTLTTTIRNNTVSPDDEIPEQTLISVVEIDYLNLEQSTKQCVLSKRPSTPHVMFNEESSS